MLTVELSLPTHLSPAQNLGLRLCLARLVADLTQEELGIELSVSQDLISRWELGYSVPDALMISKIAQATGQKPECFLV